MSWLREVYDLALTPVGWLSNRVSQWLFTRESILLHAVVYVWVMLSEGYPFQHFLVYISVEAVFATLMVGFAQRKHIARVHGHLRELLAHARRHDARD